jgi:nucleoid-associated protein YgaU
LVLNKQRAEIQLGSRLGFRSTVTQNIIGTTEQVQFLNTGTLLRLRPFVSSDDIIRMEIHPERSEGVVDPTTGLPSQTLAELTTNVMVPDGATLVIGGLMEDDDTYQQSGLPGLSRLPLLGYLFGTREKSDQRRELVVLLTPHIWSPGQAAGNHDPLAARVNHTSTQNLKQARTTRPSAFTANSTVTSRASSPATASTGRSQSSGLLPATTSYQPPPSSQATLLRGATIEATRLKHLADTLEAAQSASSLASSTSPAEPQQVSQPQRGTNAKVDPMVLRTTQMASPALQSSRPAAQDGARPATRHHVVHPGEDFSSISRDYYGSPRLARALWWANRKSVAWPGALAAGTRIILPPIEQLEGGSIASRAGRAAKIDPQFQRANQYQPAETGRNGQGADTGAVLHPDQNASRVGSRQSDGGCAIHVVRPRETLLDIARDRLGDPRRSQEIAKLNQDLVTGGRITPGMRLLLPPDARP